MQGIVLWNWCLHVDLLCAVGERAIVGMLGTRGGRSS